MSRVDWELIEMARARALADRYEREALQAAVEHGCAGVQSQQAYALGWLAMRCADRQVRLENPRDGSGGSRVASVIGSPTSTEHTGAVAVVEADGAHTPRRHGLKAVERTAPAVPTKVAAGKGGTPGRAPNPQSPQGAAGTPPTTDVPYDAWLAAQGIDPDTGEC